MYIEKGWRIINTRNNYQQRIVKALRQKGIQSFCPHYDYKFIYGGRICCEKRVLFPSIIFVYVDAAEMQIVKQIKGFKNFLYWLGNPAAVPHKDISRLYSLVNSFSNLNVEKCHMNVARTDGNLSFDKGDAIVQNFYSMGYRIIARKEFGLSTKEDPALRHETHKLPAFSLNNSLNLASI